MQGLGVRLSDIDVADDAIFRLWHVRVQTIWPGVVLLPDAFVEIKKLPHGRHGWVVRDSVQPLLRQPRDRIGVVGGIPQGRVGPLVGCDVQAHVFEREIRARVRDLTGAQSGDENVQRLPKHGARLLGGHIVEGQLMRRDAAAHAYFQPPPAHVVQHADFLRQPQGVIERQQIDQWPQVDMVGPLDGGRQEDAG